MPARKSSLLHWNSIGHGIASRISIRVDAHGGSRFYVWMHFVCFVMQWLGIYELDESLSNVTKNCMKWLGRTHINGFLQVDVAMCRVRNKTFRFSWKNVKCFVEGFSLHI